MPEAIGVVYCTVHQAKFTSYLNIQQTWSTPESDVFLASVSELTKWSEKAFFRTSC